MNVQTISQLSIPELDFLKSQYELDFEVAKQKKDMIEEALNIKFSQKTIELFTAEGRDSGTVHFVVDNYTVTIQIPKKVTWDQDKLHTLVTQIPANEAKKYVETNYKIHEQKYLAYCPISIRMILDEAREVSAGKSKITLKLV